MKKPKLPIQQTNDYFFKFKHFKNVDALGTVKSICIVQRPTGLDLSRRWNYTMHVFGNHDFSKF